MLIENNLKDGGDQLHRSSFIRQRVVMMEPQPTRAGDRVHRHQQLLRVGFLSHLRSVRAMMSQKSSVPVVGNAVPNPIRLRRLVFDGFRPTRSEPVIPAIECRRLDPEHLQRSPGRQMRLLDEADDLKLLRCGEPHVWSPPSPIMLMEWRAPPQRRRHSVCGQPIRRE
jgi:hypothetical protein